MREYSILLNFYVLMVSVTICPGGSRYIFTYFPIYMHLYILGVILDITRLNRGVMLDTFIYQFFFWNFPEMFKYIK